MSYGKASKKKKRGGLTPRKKSKKSSASEVYKIRWQEPASEHLATFKDKRIQKVLWDAAESLSQNPERGKPLVAEFIGCRRVKAGPRGRYRVIYRIRKQEVRILAVGIRKQDDRRDIYALTKRLFAQKLLGEK